MQRPNKWRASLACHVPRFLAAVLVVLGSVFSALAASGDLDPSFGNGGRVFTKIPRPAGFEGFYPNVEGVTVQTDGKILVCGRFWEDGISYWYGTFLVRYLPDGTLDPAFGTNGMVAVIGEGYPNGAHAIGADMALQPDGKIVLIGQVAVAQGILVQRYTSSGQVDTAFGNNGSTRVNGRAFPEGTSVAIQPDGKIVGVGWEYDPRAKPYYDAILIFRLNANGSPDKSFGAEGTGKIFVKGGYDGATVLLPPDGKIVVVGTLANFTVAPPALLIARYNPDGLPDSSFGAGGRVTYPINDRTYISAAALQADGKIVVAKGSQGIARFNSDGTLDQSFAINEVAPFGSVFYSYSSAVLIQSDGRIVGIGGPDFSLSRFHADGSADSAFGTAGRARFTINVGGTIDAQASAAALQPDGKIVVAGYFGHYFTDSHDTIGVIRVLSSGPSGPGGSRRRAVTRP
ncbi:MAG: hypothetical protein ABIP63_02925 [Thermoanaerobaculia bacterium]